MLRRIVLTGGPCGGKTTALARIRERLTALGFDVYLVPEAATLLFTGGVSLAGAAADRVLGIEASLLGLQLALEDSFVQIARGGGRPAVVIYDRGAMDVSAYLSTDLWTALLDEQGLTPVALRDGRYDAVIHLVTAAEGAEAFYTTANNVTRTETPEEARRLDLRLRECWLGHAHLRVIDNSTDFAGKVRRVVDAVCGVVGVPEPVEIERKFLVAAAPDPLPITHEVLEIEQVYLLSTDGSECRVRRRGQRGVSAYTHAVKRPLRAGQRVEIERPVSAREYVGLLAQRDPERRPITKRRSCFLWQGRVYELDRFDGRNAGLTLLEVELESADEVVTFPPWLTIEREVTDEPAYSNYRLARS